MMRISDKLWMAIAALAAAVPWLDRTLRMLPVTPVVRDNAWLAATLASVLCVVTGYATARHSLYGFQTGWVSMILFLVVLLAMFAVMDLLPRSENALYISCFALFSLSTASFLSLKESGSWAEPAPQKW